MRKKLGRQEEEQLTATTELADDVDVDDARFRSDFVDDFVVLSMKKLWMQKKRKLLRVLESWSS